MGKILPHKIKTKLYILHILYQNYYVIQKDGIRGHFEIEFSKVVFFSY